MKTIHVFYADDDEDDLMLFSEAVEKITEIEENKIQLHLHKNGENLIENIKNNKGNGFVFLDINMPFKTGFQLLEEIRNETGIRQFPVIIYSTSSNTDYIDKSRELGANFYAIKPYEFNNLLKMINSFIQIDWTNHQTDIKDFLYKF